MTTSPVNAVPLKTLSPARPAAPAQQHSELPREQADGPSTQSPADHG